MRLRDPLTDCKPKSKATALCCARPHSIRSPESFKNMWHVGRGNACACVANRKRNVVRMATKPDVNTSAGRRVLDRVCYEIQEQLPEPRTISGDGYFLSLIHISEPTRQAEIS